MKRGFSEICLRLKQPDKKQDLHSIKSVFEFSCGTLGLGDKINIRILLWRFENSCLQMNKFPKCLSGPGTHLTRHLKTGLLVFETKQIS